MSTNEAEARQCLLKAVKKEVKQIMEESVTRKFVHEESSSIISLCGAVEACLLHGLKKRALGLFKHGTTTALLQKIAKNFEPAAQVAKLVAEAEASSSADNVSKKSQDSAKNQAKKCTSSSSSKYLWLRIAIFEKYLAKILDYLVQNSSKYYECEALIADPVDGPIFASLLVGPCALDYTKMKTADHFWTDPPADELVQRHRIHSSGKHAFTNPGSPKRPGLQIRRDTSSGGSEETSPKSFHMSAREYVESLHQNSKLTLLYGKNNVLVQPQRKSSLPVLRHNTVQLRREDTEALPGYLSLHQSAEGLIIMWTPNQLMNGCCEQVTEDTDRSIYWDFAMTVYVDEIVYIHCHQQPDCRGTVVLVGQDGVQRPPIHFPKGGHLLSFLSCLENGLLPNGQLDPPLWSQRGKGKVFPKLRRKANSNSSSGSTSSGSTTSMEDEEATDYVFRIISTFKPDAITPEMMDPKVKMSGDPVSSTTTRRAPLPRSPLAAPSSMQSYARTQEEQNHSCLSQAGSSHRYSHLAHIKQLCDTMTKQIISRAFYGWLAHCRHLKTVRTHLSGLVYHTIVAIDDPMFAGDGLTPEKWAEICVNGVVSNSGEVYRLVYYGGISHDLRKEVWPYLLGHYKFGSSQQERKTLDESMHTEYERIMSEWLAVEAIIRQRDKEVIAANLAKLSQVIRLESTDGHIPLVRKDSSLSNEVFESFESEDFSHPETVQEESSTALTTPSEERKTSMELGLAVMKSEKVAQVDASTSTMSSPRLFKVSLQDSPDDGLGDSIARGGSLTDRSKLDSTEDTDAADGLRSESGDGPTEKLAVVTKLSVDSAVMDDAASTTSPGPITSVVMQDFDDQPAMKEDADMESRSGLVEGVTRQTDALKVEGAGVNCDVEHESLESMRHLSASKESLMSPASPASNGGIYSAELLDSVALNLHRIDKDVQRCDRHYWYFSEENLEKLRNIMCTYVWQHLEVGYVQGMCDIVAPLLVILDDEALTYSCFCELMRRMSSNFPHGGAMDAHFANMRSLIQILDAELFEHMHQHGDYTHFYFCYRWFLLDFKRELLYPDVFSVWETIWAAKHISSGHFVLFIALALVEYYRDIILDNNMDFTDIIKFFNEMAEHHNAKQVLDISRELVLRLQTLIDNK
ncbi:small G protein signaling modulator 1-like isoform X4 [Pomacea canaliculata]|uniref:small G protein signaling modulator 1-like isoform X4 n=1 Tax=Pomacea canaliculata TaxID=400727 RepID=UPI000D736FDE|nr:small G protein signaling modulator 1-like isoform X4 [Pomacea canaliculata]